MLTQPLQVTVSLPQDSTPVDDYYASHPLIELPPEEDSEEADIEKTNTEQIRECRSVERYRKITRLNEGTYGVVYKAQNLETGEIVALKRVTFEFPSSLDQVQREHCPAGSVSRDCAS